MSNLRPGICTLIAFAGAGILAGPNLALSQQVVTFDDRTGPCCFPYASPSPQKLTYVLGDGIIATFSGGVVLAQESNQSSDNTPVYATASFGKGTTNPITVTFNKAVTNLSFQVLNAEPGTFTVSDGNGNVSHFTLEKGSSADPNPLTTNAFSLGGKSVTITQNSTTTQGITYDFAVDNFSFTAQEPKNIFLDFGADSDAVYGYGDAYTKYNKPDSGLGSKIPDLVSEVQKIFGKYNVNFTSVKPASGDFHTIFIGGTLADTPSNFKLKGVDENTLGVTRYVNVDNSHPKDTAVVFSGDKAFSSRDFLLIQTIAHEAGHLLGLRHVIDDAQLMYPYNEAYRISIGGLTSIGEIDKSKLDSAGKGTVVPVKGAMQDSNATLLCFVGASVTQVKSCGSLPGYKSIEFSTADGEGTFYDTQIVIDDGTQVDDEGPLAFYLGTVLPNTDETLLLPYSTGYSYSVEGALSEGGKLKPLNFSFLANSDASSLALKVLGARGPAGAIDGTQPYYLASRLDVDFLPAFAGGQLRMDPIVATYTDDFTIDSSVANAIDAYGNNSEFSGKITNASAGRPGTIRLFDSLNGGILKISGTWGSSLDPTGPIDNETVFEVLAGGFVYATGIANKQTGVILVDFNGAISDALDNQGYVSNSGTYNADVRNLGGSASIVNETTGVWTGNILSNDKGSTLLNYGVWNGTASNTGSLGNAAGATWNGNAINLSDAILVNDGTWAGTIANAGIFSNTASGILNGRLTNSAGTTSNSGVLNAGATVSGGALTSTKTINGGIDIGVAGTVEVESQVSGEIKNAGVFEVSGTLTNDGSAFTNLATGLLKVGGNRFIGVGGLTNDAEGVVGIGTSAGNGDLSATNFVNNGALIMQNGRTGDTVTVSGNYIGGSGSIISADVNMGSNSNQADRLTAGNLSGTSVVSIQNVGAKKIYFSNPIVLISGSSGAATFTAAKDASTTAALASIGVVDYKLKNIVGTHSWGIVASLNTPAISTVATNTVSLLSAVNSQFLPDAHELIGDTQNHERWSGQVWARTGHGDDSVHGQTTTSDPNSPSSISGLDLRFDGWQLGASGRLALDHATLHFGVTAGSVKASSGNVLVSSTNLRMPFYGLYGVASLPGALLGVEAYHSDLTIRPDLILSSNDLKGRSNTVAVSLSFPRIFAQYRIEPFFKYIYTDAKLDDLHLSQDIGMLQFSSLGGDNSSLGVRFSTLTDQVGFVSAPYLSISVEQDNGRSAKTTFASDSDTAEVNFMTHRSGTYLHIGSGATAQFRQIGAEGFVRTDLRTGAMLNGYSVALGVRKRF